MVHWQVNNMKAGRFADVVGIAVGNAPPPHDFH